VKSRKTTRFMFFMTFVRFSNHTCRLKVSKIRPLSAGAKYVR
jgi:hypothetical protein